MTNIVTGNRQTPLPESQGGTGASSLATARIVRREYKANAGLNSNAAIYSVLIREIAIGYFQFHCIFNPRYSQEYSYIVVNNQGTTFLVTISMYLQNGSLVVTGKYSTVGGAWYTLNLQVMQIVELA